ncbi:16162_t:CDS:1, partial [Cetraspora pellucida]
SQQLQRTLLLRNYSSYDKHVYGDEHSDYDEHSGYDEHGDYNEHSYYGDYNDHDGTETTSMTW